MYTDGNYEAHTNDHLCSDGRTSSWATEAEVYAAATLVSCSVMVYKFENGQSLKLQFNPVLDSSI